MAGIEQRLQAFVKLGSFLKDFNMALQGEIQADDAEFISLEAAITRASLENGWFTRENILYALAAWSELLSEVSLRSWLDSYKFNQIHKHTIAIITAGNIPMVGFHDLLSVIITGNKALVRCSSNDKTLLPWLSEYLTKQEPTLKGEIVFTEERLFDFDAVIATGSNNTARYFEYYFGKKPNIIRKNRNSVAVLTGREKPEELELLGEDIFRYYGLGCRSVSKVFVPQNYDFDQLFKALFKYQDVLDQQKYLNNYDYNKAVFLMSNFKILDNGFFMIKEDQNYASPIATLYYEYYQDKQQLTNKLQSDGESIQCIVSKDFNPHEIAFGQTQRPGLTDYADGVDTVEFLLRISQN